MVFSPLPSAFGFGQKCSNHIGIKTGIFYLFKWDILLQKVVAIPTDINNIISFSEVAFGFNVVSGQMLATTAFRTYSVQCLILLIFPLSPLASYGGVDQNNDDYDYYHFVFLLF